MYAAFYFIDQCFQFLQVRLITFNVMHMNSWQLMGAFLFSNYTEMNVGPKNLSNHIAIILNMLLLPNVKCEIHPW